MEIQTQELELYRQLIPEVIKLSRAAGERILDIYNSGFNVSEKDDKTPVTEADMAAHELITEGLQGLDFLIPILSEESTHIPFNQRQGWDAYWLVDPLDGTREFIKRNGEFSVNIALIKAHKPVLGVVYTPVFGTTYYAYLGGGAFKQRQGGEAEKITVREQIGKAVKVAASRSHSNVVLQRFLRRLGNYEIIEMGSSLKSCLVADGTVDLYPRLGLTSEWDTAAAQCIVEEAGGSITNCEMTPLLYNKKTSLLNPHFFVFGDKSVDWSKYLSR